MSPASRFILHGSFNAACFLRFITSSPVAAIYVDLRTHSNLRYLGASAVALLTRYPDASKSFPLIWACFKYPEFAATIAADQRDGPSTGSNHTTPVSNPDPVAVGVKFGTLEEFVQKELVARYT
ncbi:hypothetical protein C8R47DRAFT_1329047 [Mycena vitilis]|nr:hypothetical protein C8R47DRAFT_1329047 [Mycena vitilis]